MLKIRVKINGEFHTNLEMNEPTPVKDVIEACALNDKYLLTYRVNNSHVNLDYMINQNAELDCITYDSLEGMRLYQDTAIFIMMKAFHNLHGDNAELVVEHSISDGIYCEVFGNHTLTEEDAKALKKEMQRIVKRDMRIEKTKFELVKALTLFTKTGRKDVVANLKSWTKNEITVFRCGAYHDYYIRQLADSTGLITNFDIIFYSPGLVLRLPKAGQWEIIGDLHIPEQLYKAHQEHDKWLNILRMHNVYDLNHYVHKYAITEVIQIEEALHERKIVRITDMIRSKPEARIILIAGPSSSGKTTFAKRLSVQLRVVGLNPIVIGMDDYFLPRDQTPRKENGEYDFETVNAIDIELLNNHLKMLLSGEEVELPKYDFQSGDRVSSHHKIKLGVGDLLLLEGIHGLNDQLTPHIEARHKFKIYISALNQLNIDKHNRIPTTDCRKIRRITRDSKYRGYTAEDTLKRWEAIREGEDLNIFPFQENADVMFNSSLTYELGVLKKHAIPQLKSVSRYSPMYLESRRLLRILEHFADIPDNQVPTNSLLREFTFGSVFKY